MSKELKIILSWTFIILIAFLSVRLVVIAVPQMPTDLDTSAGIEYIKSHQNNDVSQTKQATKEALSNTTQTQTQTQTTTTTATKSPTTTEKPTATEKPKPQKKKISNLDAAFKDTVICGDSIVKSISEYNILDSSQIIAEIGAGTRYLSEVSDLLISKNPQYLIIHIGENEVDEKKNAAGFAKRCKKAFEYLKSKLPNTKIVVDSIFPVEEFACKKEPYLVNIDYYNSFLQSAASEAGVTYIDFTPIWNSFNKNYYDGDGIHPKYFFYTEQYLPYIYSEVISKN